MNKLDLLCFGRVAVDLYANEINTELENVISFNKYLGGCAGNIAVGTSRLGLKTAILSKVGSDAMGKFLINVLTAENVDTKFIKTTNNLTGLVLLGVNPPDNFPLIFYRENCADMNFYLEDIKDNILNNTDNLLLTGTGFSTENMAACSKKLIDLAKNNNIKIILDLDYRPVLWGVTNKGNGESRYIENIDISKKYQEFIPCCNLIVGTEEEYCIAGGSTDLNIAIENIKILTNNKAILVIKKGEHGAIVIDLKNNKQYKHIGFKTKVLNVLGAGDGFISGFLRGFLKQYAMEDCLKFANAAGSIVVSRHGCAPAMPYFEELITYISQQENIKGVVYDSIIH